MIIEQPGHKTFLVFTGQPAEPLVAVSASRIAPPHRIVVVIVLSTAGLFMPMILG